MKQTNKNTEQNENMEKVTHPYNSYNPFIEDVVEHITETKRRKISGSVMQDIVNKATGEVNPTRMLVLGDVKVVDSTEFYKVYIGEIKSFFNLTSSSMQLFEYIMKNIQYGKDRVCMTVSIIKADIGMKTATTYRAIDQLLDRKIIAKAEVNGCYFINPKIAFKGDRITLVKQFVNEQAVREIQEMKHARDVIQDVGRGIQNEEHE